MKQFFDEQDATGPPPGLLNERVLDLSDHVLTLHPVAGCSVPFQAAKPDPAAIGPKLSWPHVPPPPGSAYKLPLSAKLIRLVVGTRYMVVRVRSGAPTGPRR